MLIRICVLKSPLILKKNLCSFTERYLLIYYIEFFVLILRKINISELSLDTKLSVILFVINSFIFPLTE